MKNIKYFLITLANYIPILCACLFYRWGADYIWTTFIILQMILVFLNHRYTKTKSALFFLHANLFLSTVLANALSTNLYYTKISSDVETLMVGDLGMLVGVVFVLLLSIISIIIRFLSLRKTLADTKQSL